MKKVINGKLYDTNTAEEICDFYNNMTGFKQYSKTLMKTEKGQYFFFEDGGALSCMCEPCGNGQTGSSNITLCTEEEAEEFAQKNDIDVAEQEFGEIERG